MRGLFQTPVTGQRNHLVPSRRHAADARALDVLIDNAGIVGARKPVGEVTAADMMITYDTNVFGVVRVTHAFLPLL
ncbi:SDR family NAD(P)-dependent oxidoreductase [Streptomyces sp. NPDC001796]|uniref:SDR family NAD(P)-dependent oxidoreductase n=1 Tax=Streptomyces sp. NPDC001796 TaxID=3364609 RepID=UPI0036ACAF75